RGCGGVGFGDQGGRLAVDHDCHALAGGGPHAEVGTGSVGRGLGADWQAAGDHAKGRAPASTAIGKVLKTSAAISILSFPDTIGRTVAPVNTWCSSRTPKALGRSTCMVFQASKPVGQLPESGVSSLVNRGTMVIATRVSRLLAKATRWRPLWSSNPA